MTSFYQDLAKSFFKRVEKYRAYEAYFGGAINYSNEEDPLNSLRIGKRKPMNWKWPWD